MKGVYICVASSVQNGFLNDPSPKETVDFRTKNNKEMYSFDKGGGGAGYYGATQSENLESLRAA